MVQLFASDIDAWTFYIVYSLWLLSEVVGAGVIPRLRRRGTQIKREDYSSSWWILVNISVSVYITFFFASSGIARWPSWVFYPGIVLMVLEISLRQWSIAVLGRFFSSIVAIQEGQKVMDNGSYRIVRHPVYTRVFLILIGLGLALQSWGLFFCLC